MIRWLIWSFFVIAWTVALEVPITASSSEFGGEFIMTNRRLFAKSMHVAAYAMLTLLSVWVVAPVRYRSILMFFLMAHACLTELLQNILESYCHRGGSLIDVALDHVGIGIGLLLTWKRWTRGDDPA